MRILITNDDGIESSVLPAFIEWAKRYGEVTVVVPAEEQSGKSQAIDFRNHPTVKKIDLVEGCEVYSMTSTPADCVRFAVLGLHKEYDIVFSGINKGYNLGDDISYSGTVGAICEASRLNMKGIAFSTDFTTFEFALREIDSAYNFIVENRMLDNTDLLNVNFPICESRGIAITLQGGAYYSDEFVHLGDGVYLQTGEPVVYEGDDITEDIHAIANGYISITPLTSSKNNYPAYELLKNLKK